MGVGIQKGTTASSYDSEKLDKQVNKAAKEIYKELKSIFPKLSFKQKISEGITPCAPDGGLFYSDDKLVAAFEAKHQGPRGNAIERWYKNFFIITGLSSEGPLLTFASGAGVLEQPNEASIQKGPIWKVLYAAHAGEFNTLRRRGPSCFLSKEGFTYEFVKNTMKEYLLMKLQ